jgi:hypothetical protein
MKYPILNPVIARFQPSEGGNKYSTSNNKTHGLAPEEVTKPSLIKSRERFGNLSSLEDIENHDPKEYSSDSDSQEEDDDEGHISLELLEEPSKNNDSSRGSSDSDSQEDYEKPSYLSDLARTASSENSNYFHLSEGSDYSDSADHSTQFSTRAPAEAVGPNNDSPLNQPDMMNDSNAKPTRLIEKEYKKIFSLGNVENTSKLSFNPEDQNTLTNKVRNISVESLRRPSQHPKIT